MPAGLVGPPRPPGSEAVWRAFGELDAQRLHTESGIPQAIQHRDVEAWCRTMRIPLHPAVNGGEKVGHWSGGVMLLRAE
uniref:phage tail assembly chaperone n=1 Tax=Roseomonas rosulenta TaxID=2748667 RepID=UPI0018DF4AA6|nr:hypothetical protein [Roseomonas rosulenta]